MTPPSKKTLYMREYRRRTKVGRIEEKARQRATNRGLWRLAELYPDDYTRFVNEEREVEGLPPLGVTAVGRPPRTGKVES